MSIDAQTALNAREDLLWIASQWPALTARLRPTRQSGNDTPVKTSDRPAPIDLHISDLMHEIEENVARFYGRVLLDETDDWTPRTSSMPGLLIDVAHRYGHFTEDDELALAFCDDANDYRHKVMRALERPAPPRYIGPCQGKGEDGAGCAGELYVREGRDAGRCPECGEAFTVAEQRDWLEAELADRLMTASEIVSALHVLDIRTPIGTVKSWISRKRLHPAADGLYRLSEARQLALRVR